MNTGPRNLPRFLPTLTEVVHPFDLVQAAVPATPDWEECARSVMQRVDVVIERRLREESEAMLRTFVTGHMQTLGESLRVELQAVVREAVAQAVTAQTETHKSK